VRSGLKIKYAVNEIINPAKDKVYGSSTSEPVKFVVGIDTSSLFVAKTGVRGANDLVWVGRAANYAAKLAALPSSYVYITKDIYENINDVAKLTNGKDMWEAVKWSTFDDRTIYRSNWQWPID